MSSTYAASFEAIVTGLDDLAQIDPGYRTVAEKQDALICLSRAAARIEAERLRIIAASDDIASASGDRSTAHWLADATRDNPAVVRRLAALSKRLEDRYRRVASSLGSAAVNTAQALVIVDALDRLPTDDLDAGVVEKAELFLLEHAADLGPHPLRILGARVLEHVAPEVSDDVEHRLLLAEERRAEAITKVTMRRRGDGTTDLFARVPDHCAARLRVFLDAYTSPRHVAGTPLADLPVEQRRGQGFVALLENIPTDALPRHGGTATTVVVTIDHHKLAAALDDAGVAVLSTGERITAGQARRLACRARILPAVLGGRSEILDVGRTRRLVTEAIRRALDLRDKGCAAECCTMPAAFCEGHHVVPWSRGGATSLANSTLLCSFHHHRAHDPGWEASHLPNGKTRFHRRT